MAYMDIYQEILHWHPGNPMDASLPWLNTRGIGKINNNQFMVAHIWAGTVCKICGVKFVAVIP